MNFTTIAQSKRDSGFSYLGMVNNGAKHHKAFNYGELVYTIYLAPGYMSGYEVCPGRTPECTALCLNESGHNRIDSKVNRINESRIAKTQMFFEDHEFFVRWVIKEIENAKIKADKLGFKFSVRINNTSDISPEMFNIKIDGGRKNILELFPDVQFYDYSKVSSRSRLMNKYTNYDLTYSFNGMNWDMCEKMLNNGVRVAVVFDQLPDEFRGFKVINGDLSDMRYYDPKNVIVGLHYKKTRSKPDDSNTFIIKMNGHVMKEVI